MITIRRSLARKHVRRRKLERWQTFFPGASLGEAGFGCLERLDEAILAPSTHVLHGPAHESELVTYVLEGGLAYADDTGGSGVLRAGEFQLVTTGRGIRREVASVSAIHAAHYFEIQLSPTPDEPHLALFDRAQVPRQKRFYWANRHHVLCLVGSAGGRDGSLDLVEDVEIHSSILDPGVHIAHALDQARSAWLHVLRGSVTLAGRSTQLAAGDGAGFVGEGVVSLVADTAAEVLLITLPAEAPESRARSGAPGLAPVSNGVDGNGVSRARSRAFAPVGRSAAARSARDARARKRRLAKSAGRVAMARPVLTPS